MKKVAQKRLNEMSRQGATVTRTAPAQQAEATPSPEKEKTAKDPLAGILAQIMELQQNSVKRQEVLLESIATSMSNLKIEGGAIDLRPLAALVAKIQPASKVPYDFVVKRDNRGLLTGITAKPMGGQQLH